MGLLMPGQSGRLKPKPSNASMRSRARLIRRTEFQLDNTRKRVALMERMIADFDCIVANLDREIVIEQERARITIRHISPIRPMPKPRSCGGII